MSEYSPYSAPASQNFFKYLLEDALQILEKQVTNPDSKDFKKITHLLKRCEVFRNIFPAQAMLNDFVQLAKYYVGHEVHEYGSVLLREKEYADKFCLILRGSVEKFRQKAYGEIEQEVKEDIRRKSSMCDGTSLPHFSTPSITITGYKSHRPSKFLEPFSQIKLKNLYESGLNLQSEDISSDEKSALNLRLESHGDEKPVVETKMVATPLSLLYMRMQNENEQEPSSTNECLEDKEQEDKSEEEPEEDGVRVPIRKRWVTNLVDSPPLFSNFSQMMEKFSRQASFPNETTLFKGGAGDETPLAGSNINNDEEELIRHVCEKDPEVKKTYFKGDVLRATKIKSYQTGEYFGESFCRPNFPKSNSLLAVSSEQVHLLTLHREDYKKIMAELERRADEKLKVFWRIFPFVDKKSVRELSHHFFQKSYNIDEVIYSQNDPSQDIYLLLSGEVKLCKEYKLPNSQKETSPSRRMSSLPNQIPDVGDIPMATVIKNQFFGEELLLEKDLRQSTAIVKSPNTVVYVLDARVYEKIKEQFAKFFDVLKGHAQEKFVWRQQMVSEKAEQTKNVPRVQRHSSFQTVPSLNGSILVVDRTSPQKRSSIFLASSRQILSEKSLGSSPRSSINSFDDKKIHSDDETQSPQAQRVEAYKSQFARKVHNIVKPNSDLEENSGKLSQRVKEDDKEKPAAPNTKRTNIRRNINLSPEHVLEEFNFRKELYGDKEKVSYLVSPKGLNGLNHTKKKAMIRPTVLPSLYDPPRTKSISGLQNIVSTHTILKRFTKKKKNLEQNFSVANTYANSYDNSPRNGPAFENIYVTRKAPKKLKFM